MRSENLVRQVNRRAYKSAEEFYEAFNKLMKFVMLLRQGLPSTASVSAAAADDDDDDEKVA
jgi:hypothetical protein